MDIKTRIEELKAQKSKLSNQIFYIDQEIYQLKAQCQHPVEDLQISKPRAMDRIGYDLAYQFDVTGKRFIEQRNVCCSICTKSWTEMRYTDAEWLESFAWEEEARKEFNKGRVQY